MVTGRHRLECPALVVGTRIAAQFAEPGSEPRRQPGRRDGRADVDREVEQPRHRGLVAVVARRRADCRPGHSTDISAGKTGRVGGTGDNGTVAVQLVIFDLDGTLTDSAEGIVASFRHALGHIGVPVPEHPYLASLVVGPPMHQILTGMGLGHHADAAIAAYRADYTTRGWALNDVFDQIPELLTDLRAAGVRLAVATSKAEPTARKILAHFGLDGHFEVIAGATLDGTRATKAQVLAHALAQLDPVPDHVLMVGDRSHDVDGAASHGIDTVVVDWGYGGQDFLDGDSSLVHVGTVGELREVLGV